MEERRDICHKTNTFIIQRRQRVRGQQVSGEDRREEPVVTMATILTRTATIAPELLITICLTGRSVWSPSRGSHSAVPGQVPGFTAGV